MSFLSTCRFSLKQLIGMIALVAIALTLVLSAWYARFPGDVHCVTFSPNAGILATGSEDGLIRFWELATRRCRSVRGHTNLIRSIAFSPDGTILASCSLDARVKLWDVASGTELATLRGHTCANAVAFSPDGKLLAAGDWIRNTVVVWDVTAQNVVATLTGHTESVNSVSFAPDGRTLASGGADGTIAIWDVGTWKKRGSLNTNHEVTAIAFSPDRRRLAAATEHRGVQLWDVAAARPLATLQGVDERLTSVAFSPDGRLLATGSATEQIHTIFPGNVRFPRMRRPAFVGAKLWDVTTGEERISFPCSATIWSVAFSMDGRTIAGASEHWVTNVWNLYGSREPEQFVARRPIPRLGLYLAGAIVAGWLISKSFRRKRTEVVQARK